MLTFSTFFMSKKIKKIITYLVLIAVLASIVFLLNSCNTLRQSQTRLFKVDRDHPELLAEYCAEKYPVTEDSTVSIKIIKGDTIKEMDTLYVDCDKVKDSIIKIIKVPYVKTISNTDTVERTVTVTKENTAALQAEIGKHKSTTTLLNKTQGKLSTMNKIAIVLGSLLLLAVILIVVIIRFKLFSKKSIV